MNMSSSQFFQRAWDLLQGYHFADHCRYLSPCHQKNHFLGHPCKIGLRGIIAIEVGTSQHNRMYRNSLIKRNSRKVRRSCDEGHTTAKRQ